MVLRVTNAAISRISSARISTKTTHSYESQYLLTFYSIPFDWLVVEIGVLDVDVWGCLGCCLLAGLDENEAVQSGACVVQSAGR